MKGRVILVEARDDGRILAALVVDGVLSDVLVDQRRDDPTPAVGSIGWASVTRLAPGMGGAFVRHALGHDAFVRDAKTLKAGDDVLVQITGHAEPGKAQPATTRVLYKSRRLIHTPHAPGINVSRKIRDTEERDRLMALVEHWAPPQTEGAERLRDAHANGGFILRTAAMDVDPSELAVEIEMVLSARIECEASKGRPSSAAGRSKRSLCVEHLFREWCDPIPDIMEITAAAAQLLADDVAMIRRSSAALDARLSVTDSDPFEHFGVWDEIERLSTPRVALREGAWMTVEATRALIAIDVNTGGDFSTAAGLKATLAAIRELPRQLRLRGLGGVVVMDPAPVAKKDRKTVENTLRQALKGDPIQTDIAGWTPLGHIEMQRKRERRPLSEML